MSATRDSQPAEGVKILQEEDPGNAPHWVVLDLDEDDQELDDPGHDEGEEFDCNQSDTEFQEAGKNSMRKDCMSADKNQGEERVFEYKGKSYCYSKHVFTEMLMKDEVNSYANEDISLKAAMKEIKPHLLEYLSRTGKAPAGNGSYPMEDFSNYNGSVEGRKIVNLMKKWNYILHPSEGRGFAKNHARQCSLGIAVAAILHVEGKRTDLPDYQADLLDKRITAGATPGMWGLCMAVIVFHDRNDDIRSPAITQSKTRRKRPLDLTLSERVPGRSSKFAGMSRLSAASPLQESPECSADRVPSTTGDATDDHKEPDLTAQEDDRNEESNCVENTNLGETSNRRAAVQLGMDQHHHQPALHPNYDKAWPEENIVTATAGIVRPNATEEVLTQIDLVEAVNAVTGKLHKSTQLHLATKRSRGKKLQEGDLSSIEKLRAEIEQDKFPDKVPEDLERLTHLPQLLDSFLAVKKEKLAQLCSMGESGISWEVTKDRLALLMLDAGMASLMKERVAVLLPDADMTPKLPLAHFGLLPE